MTPSLLGEIIDDPSRDLRRECLQALSELAPEPSEILPFLSAYAEDPDPQVRLAVIHALNDLPRLDHEGAELLMRIRRAQEPLDDHRPEATEWRRKLPNFMRPKLQKPVAPAFRQFEASLVRSVIEDHAAEMAEVAGELGEALSLDERIGFLRAFDPRQAALLLVESKSRFTDAELELLVDQVATPGVSETVVALLDDRKTRRTTLESLARRGATDIDPATRGNIEQATLALDDEDIDLQLALAAAYRLSAFETQALEIFENDAEPVARRQLALRTLRELRTAEVDRLFAVVTTLPTRSAMQLQAVDAILESPSPSARGYVIRLWPDLTPSARSRGAERLLSTAAGRDQFLQAIADGTVAAETVPRELAARHADVAASLGSVDGEVPPAQRSDGELERFLELARRPADPAEGRRLFDAYCRVCHEVDAVGGGVGPSLGGVAHRQTEDLLTSILTPSAAVEPGYRVVRVTVEGDVWESSIEGVLISEDTDRIVIRPWGREDQTIATDRIVSKELLPGSMMPEGLLQSLEPGQVSALFAFLRTLE